MFTYAFLQAGESMVTADCAMTITCYGEGNWGGVDYNCDLNEVCVVENGEAICVEG